MSNKISRSEKQMTDLVRERMKDSRASSYFGFEVESVKKGKVVFLLDAKIRHKQIHGVVHGGILAALADTTAAIAAYTVVPEGTEMVTVQLSINYLKAAPGGKITAVAKVLRAGRNFVVTECEIVNEDKSLAAKALVTFGAAAGHSMKK